MVAARFAVPDFATCVAVVAMVRGGFGNLSSLSLLHCAASHFSSRSDAELHSMIKTFAIGASNIPVPFGFRGGGQKSNRGIMSGLAQHSIIQGKLLWQCA